MKKVIVIGGGAAGMMAAIQSALSGSEVLLLEKNEKLGKKLFITGKGRCNITNACDISDLFSCVVSNPKFLYSAFYSFSNEDTMQFFESLGLPLKIERGNRVFPMSDKSSDVIRALERECKRLKITVCLHQTVRELMIKEKRVIGVTLSDGRSLSAQKVIVATGGKSYTSTGSTGDGYRLAKQAGHTITSIRPGLTGLISSTDIGRQLQGLTLRNIQARITSMDNAKKNLYEGFGELLFTHYGVSGPLMLTASSLVGDKLQNQPLQLHIDLKPALSYEQLDQRVLHDFSDSMNSDIKNTCQHLLPKSIIAEVLRQSEIEPDTKTHHITKEKRLKLVDTMKDYKVPLKGLRDIEEAIITRGGIAVTEVDPSNMESKLVSGLYFAGEILDLDALTGGYNLQIAWSTGYLAGKEY